MEAPEHHHEMEEKHQTWLNRHRWLGYCALAVIAYYLLSEHREHVFAYLPYLLLAACPLMHLFMHGGHHHDHGNQKTEPKS